MSKGITKEEIEKIKELHRAGVPREEIADQLFRHENSIYKIIHNLIENGELEEKKPERNKRWHDEVVSSHMVKNLKAEEKKRRTMNEEKTYEGEGGIHCTQEVARKCLYGCLYPKKHKCEFSLITGKCRTVSDKSSGYNSPGHCKCFQPATQKQKKELESRMAKIPSFCLNAREAKEDEEYLRRMLEFDGLLPEKEDEL